MSDDEKLYYLSFTDPDAPKGEQFIYGTIMRAANEMGALFMAGFVGCNPGGAVAVVGPFDLTDDDCPFTVADIGRPLTFDEMTERDLL